MYITNGRLKRHKLKTPPHQRLAESKVREALFNVFARKIEGKTVLDLFGGAGTVGFEMLSWGAEYCYFCDKDRRSYQTIKQNIKHLGVEDECELHQCDAFRFIPYIYDKDINIDVVIIDPPYNKDLVTKSLHALKSCDILCDTGFIVILAARTEEVDTTGYKTIFDRTYGYPRILILQKD